jgi:hypothetical protein
MRSGQIYICSNTSHQKMGHEMDEDKKIRAMKLSVLTIFIGIPLVVMFFDIAVGGFLLLIGLMSTNRAFRYMMGNRNGRYNESTQRHNANAAGKTILVQIVDDFGRELPPNEVEKRLMEAKSKADPKDTVVPVKFKVISE